MKYSLRNARIVAAGLITVALAAAGCTTSHSPSAAGNPSSGASRSAGANGHSSAKRHGGTTSTAKPVPPGKPKKISTSKIYRVSTPPGTSKGYVGAAHDVKLSKCASSKGATSFSGVVSNPTGAVQSYRIYVAVTGKSTTVGLAEVDVHNLAAKATSRWKGHLGGGVHGATCVLRVERQQSRAHHGR